MVGRISSILDTDPVDTLSRSYFRRKLLPEMWDEMVQNDPDMTTFPTPRGLSPDDLLALCFIQDEEPMKELVLDCIRQNTCIKSICFRRSKGCIVLWNYLSSYGVLHTVSRLSWVVGTLVRVPSMCSIEFRDIWGNSIKSPFSNSV